MINDIILKGIAFVSNTIASFKEERGQDLMEYAVLAGAIALVAGFVLFFAGTGSIEEALGKFRDNVTACISMDDGACI